MTWKPTESLKKADELASTIHCDIVSAGGNVTTLARHRMVQLLEEAIEQALRDGEAKQAIMQHMIPPGVATADPVGFNSETIAIDPSVSHSLAGNGEWPPPVWEDAKLQEAISNAVEGWPKPAEVYGGAIDAIKEGKEDKPKRGRPKGKGKKAKATKKAKKSKEVLHAGNTPEITEDMGREIPEQVETPQDPPHGEAPVS